MKAIAISDDKWSGDVTDKEDPKDKTPEGLFKKDAGTIVTDLIRMADGDLGKASKKLSFYINRAGSNLIDTDKANLDHAKEIIHKRIENSRSSKRG